MRRKRISKVFIVNILAAALVIMCGCTGKKNDPADTVSTNIDVETVQAEDSETSSLTDDGNYETASSGESETSYSSYSPAGEDASEAESEDNCPVVDDYVVELEEDESFEIN